MLNRDNAGPRLVQLSVRGGFGETEVLWAVEAGEDLWRVLSPPVFAYGLSRDAIMGGTPNEDGVVLNPIHVERSPGATIRLVTNAPIRASALYRDRVVPELRDRGVRVGPATFFDPRMVSIHVPSFETQEAAVWAYFDELERTGAINLWDLADPYRYDPIPPDQANSHSENRLVHKRPTEFDGLRARDRMRCSTCGDFHDLSNLEPSYARPDAYLEIPEAGRAMLAQFSKSDGRIRSPDVADIRHFLRVQLRMPIHGASEPCAWGVWVEVSGEAWKRARERWDDVDQHTEPPFVGRLANELLGYEDTLGLPGSVQLTGPSTVPEFILDAGLDHQVAVEQREGVYPERVVEWMMAQFH